MRTVLFALLSLGLHAQNSAVHPRAQEVLKNYLANRKINPPAEGEARKITVTKTESDPPLCSIPLLNVAPGVNGTMRIITPPQIESNMPRLKMPAPPCRH